MSHNGRTPPMHDRADDAAAYALGAMEPDDAVRYRRHVEECPACRRILHGFERVTATLPMAASQYAAPAELRQRVMRNLRGRAQMRKPRRLRAATWLPTVAARAAHPLVSGVAAVFLVAAVIAAIALLAPGSSRMSVVDARVIDSPGQARLRIANGRAELIAEHLPPPPAGRIYEIWLKRASHSPSATGALFSVTATGHAHVGVPGDLRGVREILVTPEPAGGSPAPTHAPVIVARLS